VGLLLLAQFVYNTSVAEKTKISPAYATYRYNPEAYYSVITLEINNQVVSLQVLDLKAFYKKLAANLVFFTKRITSYYNEYYSMELTLKKGDKVYLIRRNIQTTKYQVRSQETGTIQDQESRRTSQL
jgi:hypothetical protein